MYDYDRLYNRGSKDDNFHIKNFMLNYKKLLDPNAIKTDFKTYTKRIARVNSVMSGVDFGKNLLFVCDTDMNKDVFLCGFSKLPRICSYYYGTAMDMIDIFEGNRRRDNIHLTDDEIIQSVQDINQDVMCLYVDAVMKTMSAPYIIMTTISTRLNKRNANGDPLRTWIFYRGSYSDLTGNEAHKNYFDLYALYRSDPTLYSVITLTPDKAVTEKVGSNVSTQIKTGTKQTTALSDIY